MVSQKKVRESPLLPRREQLGLQKGDPLTLTVIPPLSHRFNFLEQALTVCLRSRALNCLYIPFMFSHSLGLSTSQSVPFLKPTLSPGDARSGSAGCCAAVPGSAGATKGSCRAPLRLTTPEPHLVVGRSKGSGKKVSFSSVAQSCPTLCDPMDYSTPGLPVHHPLLELAQTNVHRVNDATNHLILCRPLLVSPSVFPSIRVFSSESVLQIRWPRYWSFSFSISPSNECSGLISFTGN